MQHDDVEKKGSEYDTSSLEDGRVFITDLKAASSKEDQESTSDQDNDNNDPRNGESGVLGRVLSRVASRSSAQPGPPPDGGWESWSQCLAMHAVVCNTWGVVSSFGTFQTYYRSLLPDRSPSEISFIGTLPIFLMFFCGSFTGRMTDAGFFRPVFTAGSIFQIVGILCTSFCTKYWQLILAQGICIGIGNGFVFCPSLTVASTYFLKKRAIAIGIGACGAVTGGVIFPVMSRELLPRIGFAWTMRALGLVQLALSTLANVLTKPRAKPRKTGPLIELAAFKEMEYTFYAIASFLIFWGVYFGIFYLADFARHGIRDPFQFEGSLNLLLIMNAMGIIGRTLPNYLADHFGAVNLFIPISGTTALLLFCWIAVGSSTGLYIWSIPYGIFVGAIQSLFPAALSLLTTDISKIGVRMGMVFTIVSFAALTGSPIAGIIVEKTGAYRGAQAFSGSSMALGCAFLVACKIVKMRKAGKDWRAKV